jgi:RsiW-degrading membrane proteinase PrsW (M82 family)
MPEQRFHVGSFLKLLGFALAFGIVALLLHIQFGISFQAMQVATVVLLVVVVVVVSFKIWALRPRPMTAHQRKMRELQAVQERQLDAMLENERNKSGPKP